MTLNERYRALIFDFDYTLADSSTAIIRCINHGLAGLGLPPTDDEQARRAIGLSLPDTLHVLTGIQDPEQAQRFTKLFVELSDEITVPNTHMLPGAGEAVADLVGRGLALAIVSTKYRYRIEAVLEREGLRELFSVIVGGEDVSTHKPDPEGLLMALDKLGADRQNALYIGDSLTDARAAQRAQLSFVGVLSGVTPRGAFEGVPTLAILPSVQQLAAWLDVAD